MIITIERMGKPELLAVSSELPWPLDTGGHLRTFHLLRSMAQQFDVQLVAPAAAPVGTAMEALGGYGITCHVVGVPAKTPIRESLRALQCSVRGWPYVLFGRHHYAAVRNRLSSLLHATTPAVVYFDHLDSFGYRPPGLKSVVVLDAHNCYSLVADRLANGRSGVVRGYFRREARLLRAQEEAAASSVDALFAVSEAECEYYRALGAKNVVLVPNGVDTTAFAGLPTGRNGAATIVYIGSFSWEPNVDAAMFLAKEVLPQIRAVGPNVRLQIVGKDPPPQLLAMRQHAGVEVTGTVPSVVPYLEHASLLAVPLSVGGGTRLKILEALAAGLPVVSTAVGAEGLHLIPEVHLRLAERPAFADAVIDLLQRPDVGARLASAGRELVRRRYDWQSIGVIACEVNERLVAGGRTAHQ